MWFPCAYENYMWLWGEGCDLGGWIPGFEGRIRDGTSGRIREPCPQWQNFTQLFTYSFTKVSCQHLGWGLPTRHQVKLELANTPNCSLMNDGALM